VSAIELTNVSKAFGDFVALEDLNISINDGEFVALLGPSGCGKSTTLRMLAGLEFPTSGEIRIGGRVVNDVPPGKRDIAMVFQSYALYPHMSVRKNMAYPLKKRGIAKAERAEMVAKAAGLLQLEPLLDRKPKQLSGGQQQRVALGRALVREPQVFLLDEPLSNLDAKLRSYMRSELVGLHNRIGRTMVYVTHDQLEAMTMADRIAVMHDGHLQQFDTPDVIYNRPANLFVAGFMGTPSMNLIKGELAEDRFQIADHSVPLDRSVFDPDAGTGAAVLGIRPEDIALRGGPIPGTVRLVENTGHEKIVSVELQNGDQIQARTTPKFEVQTGQTVDMGFTPERIHLFEDAGEGRRLNLDVAIDDG